MNPKSERGHEGADLRGKFSDSCLTGRRQNKLRILHFARGHPAKPAEPCPGDRETTEHATRLARVPVGAIAVGEPGGTGQATGPPGHKMFPSTYTKMKSSHGGVAECFTQLLGV